MQKVNVSVKTSVVEKIKKHYGENLLSLVECNNEAPVLDYLVLTAPANSYASRLEDFILNIKIPLEKQYNIEIMAIIITEEEVVNFSYQIVDLLKIHTVLIDNEGTFEKIKGLFMDPEGLVKNSEIMAYSTPGIAPYRMCRADTLLP